MQKLEGARSAKKASKDLKVVMSVLDFLEFGPNPFSHGRCELAEYLKKKKERDEVRS